MNWEAVNAIAQLISSVGVVGSLLYLAVQVHRSTRITKLAALDAATTALRDVTRPFAENPEVGRIWRKGLEDLDALSPEEKARFFHVARLFLGRQRLKILKAFAPDSADFRILRERPGDIA